MKHLLAFLGVLAVGLPGLLDILHYRGIVLFDRLAGQNFITPIGMMFFVFCYALVVAIGYAETERARLSAEQSVAALERVNLLKTDLMRTISHETRTPLAVIMGFAEITAEDARKNGMSEDSAANLDVIAQEARRMADMMEEMRQLALVMEDR
jgi:signal transduction histidine kinase